MIKKSILVLFFLFFNAVFAFLAEGGRQMQLTSPEFKNMGPIPDKFTCDGQDISPALEINGAPEGAKSLVLIVDDPDAPKGTWVHWAVFDIPPATGRIKEGDIPGKQGINNAGQFSYHGPCPPSGTHRYFFKIYALDTLLNLKEKNTDKAQLEKAMQGHILDKAELIGVYSRK